LRRLSVIWLVEKPRPGHDRQPDRLADALIGDYAVRLFASIESFQKILRFNRRTPPDLLVVDAAAVSWTPQRLADFLGFNAPATPCLLIGSPCVEETTQCQRGQVTARRRPVDGLGMSRLVVEALKTRRQGADTLVHFKDVQLDCERFQVRLLPDERGQTLPLKEAQILRLLLEAPGTCLSRDKIIERLWAGVHVTPRTVDSHVSRLRKRLAGAEAQIESVYGGGYILR
jgi:hypothetical protein